MFARHRELLSDAAEHSDQGYGIIDNERGMKIARHKTIRRQDVIDLGKMLIEISDKYPLQFRTERDFFPLVAAYLTGRVPSSSAEWMMTSGKVDFRIGGTNPAVLELAVAPRRLVDIDQKELSIPGHGNATQLYATQNRTELKKLASFPHAQAKRRFLLLVDLRACHDTEKLKEGYCLVVRKLRNKKGVVRVVYVSGKCEIDFLAR